MLDDLERVEEIPAAIGRLVKETMALGQVPAKKPARAMLAAAEAQKLIKTFGLPDDGPRRTKAAQIVADGAVEAWPRELARLYGCKESELKGRLGEVRQQAVRQVDVADRHLIRRAPMPAAAQNVTRSPAFHALPASGTSPRRVWSVVAL